MTKKMQSQTSVVTVEGDPQHELFELNGYGDKMLRFNGMLFSDRAVYATEGGAITRMRLFRLSEQRLVYSIVTDDGAHKESRVYLLAIGENDMCDVDNGFMRMVLPVKMIFPMVFGMCGLDEYQEAEVEDILKESLKAAGM